MAEAITIARPYATAIFRLAKAKKKLSDWSKELAFIAGVTENAQIKLLIDNPKLPSADLERALLSVFDGKLSDEAVNLVKLLVENNRLGIVADIVAAFEELKDEDEGKLEAKLTAAAKPTDAQVKALVSQLETKFGKKVEAEVLIDPELIGGIKIVVGDTVIDASVKAQLQSLDYALKS
jgi:F-type H+-transporting ATPase subunit delta